MLPLYVGLISALSLGLASCTSTATTVQCHRYEAGYLGPQNNFQLAVPMDKMPVLDDSRDRLTLSLSLLPPSATRTTRATLIHKIGGRDVARWQLTLPPPQGISSRCNIGPTKKRSNCGARLTDLPIRPGGEYILQSDNGRLIEAGLSFFICE
jgi:hypothetical protein